ncbi:hypothetical protein, conserved [Eimeria praecox]|uniref:Uncharacterized protein n=1 Tax=Eimeria praecox TaxID=51316 RepID=U6H4E7_9EIME|nr:hypothetical protein, conserved [Eimeria praecox]
MDEVRLSMATPFRKGGEEALIDEQQAVHAADFAAGGGMKAAGLPTTLQQGFGGKALSCRHGAVQSAGHACITSEYRREVQAAAVDNRECYIGNVKESPLMSDRSRHSGALRAVSSEGTEFSAEHDKIFQWFGEDLMHEPKVGEPRRLGLHGEFSKTGRETLEWHGLPERDAEAGSSVWYQRASTARDGDCQEDFEPFGDGGKERCTEVSGESKKPYRGRAWRTTEDGALTAGVLPSREDLVRRLLPMLPQNCAALLMKSSIESLYDDSVAAVSSSQAAASSPKRESERCTERGAGDTYPGKPFEESGRHIRVFTSSRCAPAAAVNRDNERGACLLEPGVESGEKVAEASCDADRLAQETLKRISRQGHNGFEETRENALKAMEKGSLIGECGHNGFEETRENALKAMEKGSLIGECVGDGGSQPDSVVYVVREEWEAFTLYYCSHTGVVRAVASEVSRVTARNTPPDLCRGLPTMAVGGAGCQQCRKQQSRPCSGWWRSRYVLLRVTVTLADRSSGGSTLRGGLASTCCEHVEGGSPHADNSHDGREFAAESLGPSYDATDHAPPSVRDASRAEERPNNAASKGRSPQAEVALTALLKEECPLVEAPEGPLIPAAADATDGIEAPRRPSIAGDIKHEPVGETWAANERRIRLASLLSSPCDSFEGFVSSGNQDMPAVGKEMSSTGSSADCLPPLPYLWAARGGMKASEVPDSSIPSCEQQQLGSHGETKFRERSWQYSGAHKSKRRGLRRTFKTQAAPCIDSGGGARRALAQCYAVCASTIGVEAVAEAQNSYLGLCVEERELAAVFLDFVALVAPGAIKTSDSADGTRPTPQPSHLAPEVVVQNYIGRAHSVKKGICSTRRAKAEGPEGASCAANLARGKWDGNAAQCVGRHMVDPLVARWESSIGAEAYSKNNLTLLERPSEGSSLFWAMRTISGTSFPAEVYTAYPIQRIFVITSRSKLFEGSKRPMWELAAECDFNGL